MGVFFVLLLVPIAIQHLSVRGFHIDYAKKNRYSLFFFFILLTFLIAFRHESVGTDTKTYIYAFERLTNASWDNLRTYNFEIGFSYFNKIVSLFSKEPQVFLVVSAIAIITMMYPTYKRLCVDSSLTIVLFCMMSTFVMMFSGIRQMLAVGVGFLAYECTRKKKLFLFIFVVIIAMSFHTSAFIIAFMYPLYHVKITKKWLYAIIPAWIVVFVFNEQIFSIAIVLLERYTKYDGSITETGAYTMMILFILFSVFAFLIPDESLMDEETIGLRNFLLFSVAIQMFAPLHPLVMRMNYYYIIFIPLLLPKIIEYRSKRWNQVALAGRYIMVLFFLLYFFYSAYTKENNLDVFPYHFFWEVI